MLKLHYHRDTDSLYMDLIDKPSVDSEEVRPCIVLDFDAEGNVVGIDIDRAGKIADLSCVEIRSFPAVPASSSHG